MASLVQIGLMVGVSVVAVLGYLVSDGFREGVNRAVLTMARGDVEALRDYILTFGAGAPIISLLLMVLQALIAPVPGFLIVFANGLAFGWFWGWVISLAGQALAAALCFWIARTLGRGAAQALIGRFGLEAADGWIARRGPYGIVVARLMPGMAFDNISFGAGLTRIGFWRFMAATVAGAAPQTFLYVYLGQSAAQYAWAMLAGSALVIGGFAAATFWRKRRQRLASSRAQSPRLVTSRRLAALSATANAPVVYGRTYGGRATR
jgi:uncharacterized membrane protein YdjX (TVP38/TMEM64 family)